MILLYRIVDFEDSEVFSPTLYVMAEIVMIPFIDYKVYWKVHKNSILLFQLNKI